MVTHKQPAGCYWNTRQVPHETSRNDLWARGNILEIILAYPATAVNNKLFYWDDS